MDWNWELDAFFPFSPVNENNKILTIRLLCSACGQLFIIFFGHKCGNFRLMRVSRDN